MNRRPNRKWNDSERFAFSTQNLRAQSIPSRRPTGPTADEWDFDLTHECPECHRVFDLTDPVDAMEASYGHDCEA